MPKKYQIWDKKSIINTPSGHQFTADEWLNLYPWAKAPKAKMVITAGDPEEGDINGGIAINFKFMISSFVDRGLVVTDGMTDDDILDAIEAIENAEIQASMEPSAEERTASALEYLVINSLPDEDA